MFSKQAKRLIVALIRPVNYFEEKQISRRNFLRKIGGTIIGGSLLATLLGEEAKANPIVYTGGLTIENYVNSGAGTEILRIVHNDDVKATEGYDTLDLHFSEGFPSNRCSLYSEMSSHKLIRDHRPLGSTSDFLVKLVYKGTLSSDAPNSIKFELPYGPDFEFGDKDILFQSDLLPYGTVVDVRRAIAENGGIVPLVDLPAGTYDPNTPYGEGILTVGTRILSDLVNEVGTVNFQDFAELSKDWKKPQGQYVGDITGPNGIPDGYVDPLDLSVFSSEWLKTI